MYHSPPNRALVREFRVQDKKVAMTCMRVEPMVVDLQRHIREGLESSCIFHGVFFISECCFFGFLVSMTTKITVQRGGCEFHSMRKRERLCVSGLCRIVFLSCRWHHIGNQRHVAERERDDVAHCFCLRSHCCFLSPNSLKDNRSTVNCVLLRRCR